MEEELLIIRDWLIKGAEKGWQEVVVFMQNRNLAKSLREKLDKIKIKLFSPKILETKKPVGAAIFKFYPSVPIIPNQDHETTSSAIVMEGGENEPLLEINPSVPIIPNRDHETTSSAIVME
ncbi:sucrose-phosphate synthase family protein [Striga asiatica]|uniref:Sucrose-phosphate synthase family protein n=1 Tax=Striga asiatica TaxID=4170 RepID=A0A5A7QNL3_STRAF|nr:sucrose-phosphate synthase family protein [Striga asiatica]